MSATTDTTVSDIEAAAIAYSRAMHRYLRDDIVAAYLAGCMRGIDVGKAVVHDLANGVSVGEEKRT